MVRDAPMKRKGFALQLELILFMLAIAIIVGGVVFMLRGSTNDSKISRAKSDLATISVAINQSAYEMRKAPSALRKLSESQTETGEKITDPNTYGPWLQKSVIKDPWGNEYVLDQIQENGAYVGYIVYSRGPKGSGTVGKEDFTADNNQRLGSYSIKDGAIGLYGRYGSPLTETF